MIGYRVDHEEREQIRVLIGSPWDVELKDLGKGGWHEATTKKPVRGRKKWWVKVANHIQVKDQMPAFLAPKDPVKDLIAQAETATDPVWVTETIKAENKRRKPRRDVLDALAQAGDRILSGSN